MCQDGLEDARAACAELTLEEALELPAAQAWAYWYARYVLKGRWPEAEGAIAKDPKWAYFYARIVMKGRWPEGEGVIAQDPEWAYFYARDVIKSRWPEAEGVIAQDPEWARLYARYVWPGEGGAAKV